MPKDSPCNDGRAEHIGPGQPGRHLRVAEHAQPVHPLRWRVASALHLGTRTVSGHPQDRRPVQRGEGVEEDLQTLARLVTTEEQHGGTALGIPMGRRRLEAVHLDPVEQHLEVATARAHGRLAGGVRDRHADLHAAPHELHQRVQRAYPSAHPGPMVGGDHREWGGQHQAVGGHRRQGLVQVRDVEVPAADETLGACRGRRPERHGGHRPVRAQFGGPPDDVVVPHRVRHAVARRRHHGHLVAPGAQGPRQPDDLSLHAAGARK